jgi:uncharacterized protein YjbI with pentapeptide repeats
MEEEKNVTSGDKENGKEGTDFWPAFWNSRPAIFFLLLVGILIGVVIMLILKGYSGDIANLLLYVSLAFFALLLLLFVAVRYLKNRFNRLVFGSEDVDYSKTIAEAQTFTNSLIAYVVDRLPQSYKGDRTIAKNLFYFLGNFLVWGRLRNWWWNWVLGLFVAIGGLAGTLLLVNQNELLQNQNQLIKNQMSLEEASRRGTLVMLMSNIFDKVDREIEAQKEKIKVVTDSTKFKLSQSLIGQIAALSQAFKPYRFMDGDTLINKPLSPERGQLLVTICGLPLDTSTISKIFNRTTFESADLREANLTDFSLKGVNLGMADMSRARLVNVNLFHANLYKARLNHADLTFAKLSRANLRWADLREAFLIMADLNNAILYRANLRKANLDMANLSDAYLGYADLKEAFFNRAVLSGSDLNNANLSNSQGLTLTQIVKASNLYNCVLPNEVNVKKLKKEYSGLFKKSTIEILD